MPGSMIKYIKLLYGRIEPVRKGVGTPLQTGKRLLCAALTLLMSAVLLLPARNAYAYTAPEFRNA